MSPGTIAIIIIAVVVVVFLFSPLTISIAYSEKGLIIGIRLWFIKYKVISPEKKARREKRKKTGEAKKEKPLLSDILGVIKDIKAAVDEYLSKFLGRFNVKKLFLKIRLGTGNAAQTAIALGTLNAALYSLLARISNYTYLPMDEIGVEPDFEKATFSVELETIISFRIIYIFAASVDILKLYLKLKREHPSLFKGKVKMKGGL